MEHAAIPEHLHTNRAPIEARYRHSVGRPSGIQAHYELVEGVDFVVVGLGGVAAHGARLERDSPY